MKSVTESGFPFLMERQPQASPTINSYIIPSNAFGRPIQAPIAGLTQDNPISSIAVGVRNGSTLLIVSYGRVRFTPNSHCECGCAGSAKSCRNFASLGRQFYVRVKDEGISSA